ncbi:HEAT repeat protein [Oesophagostomum dentatum]|uniref:HEAT repeat protein n=1 Tax=Oesophagostomum dentatum TaxID=61180 RepID=A0A0B1TVH8_OESDE|nr:HEAT repeat protein [Oesophagostomum dentatum]
MLILIREFASPDEEMKKILLKVVKQCCATDGVEAPYIRDEILSHFFKAFWTQRIEGITGILYAFQEQTQEDAVMLDGFGTVCKGLGRRKKPYLPQIYGTIIGRLNNKSAKVRQQAADLIARVAPVMYICEEEKLMGHLGVVLYECLGEEYPEVLGSILGALC